MTNIERFLERFLEQRRADGAVHVRVREGDCEIEVTFAGPRRGAPETGAPSEPELSEEERQRAAEDLLYYSAD